MTELTSPLAHKAPLDGGNQLLELPQRGKINLRGDANDENFLRGMRKVLGFDLPLVANTLARGDNLSAYWLGPDEWQIFCALGKVAALSESIAQTLGNAHYACTEVSDYYVSLQLKGADVADLIAKGCPLDLHDRAFPPDTIAQTRFGHASVLLHKHTAGDCFDIQVRWSFAEYVWDYLAQGIAMLE